MDKVYINETFTDNLRKLNSGKGEDYINIYRVDGNKVFFRYGERCRFHITKEELQEYKRETEQ